MSVFAYVGLPGSGKSYSVVANQVVPALKRGRRVVTNLPLYRDELRRITPKGEIVEFPTEAVATNPEAIWDYCTNGSVVILDEVWRLWPSGQKTHQVPEPFKALLAEHRHKVDAMGNSMQIVLVTQDVSQLAAFARKLVEITFHHTRLDHVGASKKYRVGSYRGEVSGTHPPESRLIRSTYGSYRQDIFKLYKSHTQSDSAKDGANETAVDRRATVWRRPMIWIGLLFVVAAPAFAISTLHKSFFAEDATVVARVASGASATRPTVERSIVSPSSTVQDVITRPTAPRDRPAYRIAGYVALEVAGPHGSGFAAISDGQRIVNVPWSSCWRAGDGLTRCSFNGHVVTELGVE